MGIDLKQRERSEGVKRYLGRRERDLQEPGAAGLAAMHAARQNDPVCVQKAAERLARRRLGRVALDDADLDSLAVWLGNGGEAESMGLMLGRRAELLVLVYAEMRRRGTVVPLGEGGSGGGSALAGGFAALAGSACVDEDIGGEDEEAA